MIYFVKGFFEASEGLFLQQTQADKNGTGWGYIVTTATLPA
jgi:hypothetical protein